MVEREEDPLTPGRLPKNTTLANANLAPLDSTHTLDPNRDNPMEARKGPTLSKKELRDAKQKAKKNAKMAKKTEQKQAEGTSAGFDNAPSDEDNKSEESGQEDQNESGKSTFVPIPNSYDPESMANLIFATLENLDLYTLDVTPAEIEKNKNKNYGEE